MNSRSLRILREVDAVSVELLAKEPFFGHFFTGMLRKVSEEAPTLGVQLAEGQQVQLVINPDFWEEKLQQPEHRYGLIKHELLHIVFKHLTVRTRFPLKMLFNIAADIVVNQYIERDQLPEAPVLSQDFAALGIEPGKDVGYYYEKLLQEVHERMKGGGKRKKQARKKLKELLEGNDEELKRHQDWSQFDDLPVSARSVLENAIDQALQRTLSRTDRQGQEHLPTPLQSQLEALKKRGESRVHWKRILRLFGGSSQASKLQNTIRRPSRRYGTTPGTRLVRKQRMLVAVDSSASINQKELSSFFDEIHHLWRLGAEIMVIVVDTEVREAYAYKGRRKPEVHGRGGTEFDPALAYARDQWLPDGVIYFTDGFGPVPKEKIRPPILWLITQEGLKPDSDTWRDLPGRKVKMVGN
jgi:predicted metal-dependent peptidase